jgi:hypothetical protein
MTSPDAIPFCQKRLGVPFRPSAHLERPFADPIIMKADFFGCALNLAIASSSVHSAFGLSGELESNLPVANLQESEPARFGCDSFVRYVERVENTTRNGPQYAGFFPFQNFAPTDL